MNDDKQRSRLGRGLAALIGEVQTETDAIDRARGQRKVPIEFVAPNPANPRRSFNSDEMDDLTQSVRAKGIVQPILVRPTSGPQEPYQIIAGERRWRAAQKAGLADVPVIIIDLNDREALEVAIVENVQRSDLNAVEEARGYQKLIDEFGYTQTDLAEMIGKSRSHVANTMRLLKLPDEVQSHIETGELTAGHARALITSDNPEELASTIISGNMSVRDAETLAKGITVTDTVETPLVEQVSEDSEQTPDKSRAASEKKNEGEADMEGDPDSRMLESQLTEALGLKVLVSDRGGKGELKIAYGSLEQLDMICNLLRG